MCIKYFIPFGVVQRSTVGLLFLLLVLSRLCFCSKAARQNQTAEDSVAQLDVSQSSGDTLFYESHSLDLWYDAGEVNVSQSDSGTDIWQPDAIWEDSHIGPSEIFDTKEGVMDKPPCVDKDGDGYGDNCFLGPDCDDENPNFNLYCPPCENDHVEGCKCEQEGAAEICYEADPATVGVGQCQLGQRKCLGGFWTACLGQIVPESEVCDTVDNDCDGETDEGVLSPCGNCDPFCDTLTASPDEGQPFEPDETNSEGVSLNLDGYLVLDSTNVNLSFIWVANSGEGTVSKLDTESMAEIGRYKTCSDPSRTAVDLYGNVWVACRGDGGVAKIAIDKALCIDKNQDQGVIQTSEDFNGDGIIQSNEMFPNAQFPNLQDECILFIAYPGGSCARAVGVDKDNYAWVGFWHQKVLRRLHPDDGHQVASVSIPANPYGLVIDSKGIIWVSGRGGNKLVKVDPNVDPPQVNSWDAPGGNLYGISMDANGDIWLGQFTNGCVVKFDVETSSFTNICSNLGGHCPRGMVGSIDGYIYSGLGCSGDHHIARIDIETNAVDVIDIGGGCHQPIGISLDAEGNVWAIAYQSSSACKIDPISFSVKSHPVGLHPYTYSDMTGYLLTNFTAPKGYYEHLFGGWTEIRVKWTALYVEADTPENAYLKVDVRTADSPEDLELTSWEGSYGPYPPDTFPLDLTQVPNMDGKYLQVKVWLYSGDKKATPIVKAIKVKFESD